MASRRREELSRRGNMGKGLELRRSWMNCSVLRWACYWYFGWDSASWCGGLSQCKTLNVSGKSLAHSYH